MADTAPRAAPIATEFSPSAIWWLSVPLSPVIMESVPELVVGGCWPPAVGHAVQSGQGVQSGHGIKVVIFFAV